MFARREALTGPTCRVEVAFTDRHGGVSAPPYDSLDLGRRPGREGDLERNLALLAAELRVDGFATMRQVHSADVVEVSQAGPAPRPCDALVTTVPDVALCVRVGDCVPLVLADVNAAVLAVAHAGRAGIVAGVVPAVVEQMRRRGAATVHGWIGPHICGGCYEVPAELRSSVADVLPAAYACTTWGSPSLDLGAAVVAQLRALGCVVHDAAVECTRESPDLYSYRRDGDRSGRFAGLAVLRRGPGHDGGEDVHRATGGREPGRYTA